MKRTSVVDTRIMATGGDMSICGACSMPRGLQGFLPHLSGDIGGYQHAAEFELSMMALRT